MTPLTIALQRLANQHLTDPELDDPVELVRRLGAVQAQDYPAAKWAIALRTRGVGENAIEQALSDGALVRTHVLRPTWHVVAAEDIRWMLALTAPRVRAACAASCRKLGLDDAVFRRSNAALVKALRGGQQLTRNELAAVLARARIDVSEPLRLAFLLMRAELDAIVCSGARRGKQFTYALLDERVPAAPLLSRDDALAELASRYIATRGPATVQDLAWWAGLTVADAKKGVAMIESTLLHDTVGGRTHWFGDTMRATKPRRRAVHLLPNYDEFFIGFRDRSAVLQKAQAFKVPAPTGAPYAHVVTVNGQIVGGWKRSLGGEGVSVELDLVVPLAAAERRAAKLAAQKYASHLGLPLAVAA